MGLDDAPHSTASRLLRGLDPIKDIIEDDAQETTELNDAAPKDTKAPRSTHSTRSSRRGHSEVNYDMKYHPMDAVTRPNARSTQRHRSKSVSLTERTASETEDSSELSDPPDSEEESSGLSDPPESEEEDVEEQIASDNEVQDAVETRREKDPRAVRQSARGEARKFVNYSKSYHPQDSGIPGYRHKAKLAVTLNSARSTPKPKQKSVKRSAPPEDEEDGEDQEQNAATAMPKKPPRKKLKSVDTSSKPRKTKTTADPKKTKQAKAPKKASRRQRSKDDEVDDLVDTAILGSQAPKLLGADDNNGIDAFAEAAITGSQAPKRKLTPVELDNETDSFDLAPAAEPSPHVASEPSPDDVDLSDRGYGSEVLFGPDRADAAGGSSHTLGHSDHSDHSNHSYHSDDDVEMHEAIYETTTAMFGKDEDTQDLAATLHEACSPSSDTLNVTAGSHDLSTTTEQALDLEAAVPDFIKNRYALAGGAKPLTNEKVLMMMLEDYRNSEIPLEIIKPYLVPRLVPNEKQQTPYQSPESQQAKSGELRDDVRGTPFASIEQDAIEHGSGGHSAMPQPSQAIDRSQGTRPPLRDQDESDVSPGSEMSCSRSRSLSQQSPSASGDASSQQDEDDLPSPGLETHIAQHFDSHFAIALGEDHGSGTDPIDGFSEV